jgi:hypothetical protein
VVCGDGPGGGPPALHARFPSVPTSGVRSPVIHQFPPLGFDPRRDSIYDKSLTGEPILPSRTADQYLARYWSAVRDGKIGSPVRDLSARCYHAGRAGIVDGAVYAACRDGVVFLKLCYRTNLKIRPQIQEACILDRFSFVYLK